MNNYFQRRNILVLGATGTLGNEIIKQLLKLPVASIRAYARHEESMFWLRQQYGEDRMRYLIGDIRDKERLSRACEDVDIIINCAALKHVRICSENPFEAIKTNVQGTQNAIECAIEHCVDLFVQISTDKAVNPVCTYGYTKALSEQLTLEAPNYQGHNRTKFCVFRSGNILRSSGSCFEIWDNQYKNNQPLTVTDLEALRYMARREDIVSSILETLPEAQSGLYVLQMPAFRVKEL
jgi:FlaA1/EpsC-like NDP-sugar epimerase